MFSFHKNNYDYLSKELRSMYVEYEWINVWKKGTTIYVDIIASQEEKIDYKDDFSADIVAGKSGIINQYSVYNGEINIEVGIEENFEEDICKDNIEPEEEPLEEICTSIDINNINIEEERQDSPNNNQTSNYEHIQ
jgi:hypothetical protein